MVEVKTDFAYIVSHGLAARMVRQTGLLEKIAGRGFNVGVISTEGNNPNLEEYCRNHNIGYYCFDGINKQITGNYQFKRSYILENITENVALYEKHYYALLRLKAKNPWYKMRPLWYLFVHYLVKLFPIIRENFLRDEQKKLKGYNAKLFLEKISPSALISTYPVSLKEASLLQAGNELPGTKTIIHLLSWDNITCKGRFAALADKYIAWGKVMAIELEKHYGVNKSNINITGVPHFDLHFETHGSNEYKKYLKIKGLNPDYPYLFFAMSSPRFAPGEIEIVEWLADIIGEKIWGEMQLIIRPHPQNVSGYLADKSWLPRLKELEKLPHIVVDYPDILNSEGLQWSLEKEDMIRQAHLLEGCTVMINSGSTMSIDALCHNKPVIITAFDGAKMKPYWLSARRLVDFPHLATLNALGGYFKVDSFEQLKNVIGRLLKKEGTYFNLIKHALKSECMPGKNSTQRVIDFLIKEITTINIISK